MKKLFSVSIAVFLLAIILSVGPCGFTASAVETEGVYSYAVLWWSGEVEIKDVDDSISGDVVIPDTLGGYPVTIIGEDAFRGCTNLRSVTLPDGVKSIDDNAFRDCTGLEKATLPDSVTTIEGSVFYGCTSLKDITIPDSVTSIGSCVFEQCSGLTSVTIPDGLKKLSYRLFSYCTSLESVTIPNSVESIGVEAFRYCESLKNITIPDSVTQIDSSAFTYCSNLESFTFPNGVTNISDSVLSNCSSLENVTIPDGVTSIFDYAFYNCTSLESITIPTGVTSIGRSAFKSCTSLKSIILPEGVTSIDHSAFHGCTGLESITIPPSVTNIGVTVFYDVDAVIYCYKSSYALKYARENGLTYVYIDGTEEENTLAGRLGKFQWSLNKKTGLLKLYGEGSTPTGSAMSIMPWNMYRRCVTSIELPNTLTGIGDYIFSGLDRLKSITIPDSVTSIGSYAFKDCKSLENITIPESVTSIGEGVFDGCRSLTSFTVPNGVTSIDDHAFSGCASLERIEVPKEVGKVGTGAFSDCSALEKLIVYNKKCEFDPNCGLSKNNTIYGFKGSTAETFADQIGAKFVDIMTIHKHTPDSSGTCKECGLEAIEITKQPKTSYTQLGEKAKFTVKAEGEGLKYQWYYKDVDGKEYKKCSGTEASYSIKMTEARKDRKLYCVITDQYGYSVKSKTVTMKMAASIKTQPKTQYVQLGDKAKFTVKAVGDDLKYQWYYKSAGSSKYKKASCTKATYTITQTEDRKDRKFYCIIKDKYGNEVKTKTVTLKMAASIKTEPKSVKTSIGKKAKFTVKAVGDDLKYQWYYKDTDGKKYKKASCTKATYSIELTKARNGRKFYCVVTDKYGNTVKSKTVSMKKK